MSGARRTVFWLAAIASVLVEVLASVPASGEPMPTMPGPTTPVPTTPVPVPVLEGPVAPPEVPEPALPILGEHTTDLPTAGAEAPRAANIRRAGELLDGWTVPSGDPFSFNDVVGERTLDRGFVRARILRSGAFDQGIGGGICQLASTLLVAALRAGLPIDRARPHSRIQRYAPPGMDVAIAWQRSDLWLTNDFDRPIRIEVTMVDDGETAALTARIRGASAPREVDLDLDVQRDLPVADRVRIDRHVPEGERRVLFDGVRGAEVRRTRTIRYPDGTHRTEVRDLRYPPVPREVRVHDASGLP